MLRVRVPLATPFFSCSVRNFGREKILDRRPWVMGLSKAIRSRLPSPHMQIRYEDMVADLEGTSRRVLAFLGLEWNPRVLRFNDHAKTKLLRCGIDAAV